MTYTSRSSNVFGPVTRRSLLLLPLFSIRCKVAVVTNPPNALDWNWRLCACNLPRCHTPYRPPQFRVTSVTRPLQIQENTEPHHRLGNYSLLCHRHPFPML